MFLLRAFGKLLLPLAWLGLLSGMAFAQETLPAMTKADDGSWRIAGHGYTATVNAAGYLASWKVGAVEIIGRPFEFNPNAKFIADTTVVTEDTLKVHLKGNGEATIDYQFRPDGITITPTAKKPNDYNDCLFTASPALLGIELLNSKGASVGDSMRFLLNGEIRGVPAYSASRNQMVRFHFPGFTLHAYFQAWGAPFNYESAGNIRDFGWGRSLMNGNPIVLTIQRARPGTASPVLKAPVFMPKTNKVCSLYYNDEPCAWTLDLGDATAYKYLLDAGIKTLNVGWRVTDIHDTLVASGKDTLKLDAVKTAAPVTITTMGSGYFQVTFTLSEPAGKMLPSSFMKPFTVIHNIPGLTNRDDTLIDKNISDYAIVAMIGVGAIRESHNVGEFFSNTAPNPNDTHWVSVEGTAVPVWMNVGNADGLFNTAAAESKKYNLTYFFQANSRPKYADPQTYEAMAYALVNRYKDRCQVWEVENEPNFSYNPTNYTNQCLIPFAKGAKRADPTCIVMGPDGCGVHDTVRFLDTIYALGAGQYLDNVSTHSYPGPGESWEQFGNIPLITKVRDMMAAHGDGQKALWQTEQGYTWDLNPKMQAARYATRQFLQGCRLGILPSHHYYFYPKWAGFESWYQAGCNDAGSEMPWLPTAAAQHFLAENIVGKTYTGDLPAPYKGIYLSRFSGATDDTIAVWTFDFSTKVALKTDGFIRVIGYMGNPSATPVGADGVITLAISGEPLYLHVTHGAVVTVMPTTQFGTNYAAAVAGSTASASSATAGNPAALAIDGNWQMWDNDNAIGLPQRTAWKSAQKDPSIASPDWLEVTFPSPRTINRMVALCYLPAVSPAPRDYTFQAFVQDRWVTVGSATGAFTWTPYCEFAPVTATKIRFTITQINDGWHGDRAWMYVLMGPKATNYTESKVMVSELEAYGPPLTAEVRASVTDPVKTQVFTNDTATVTISNHAATALSGVVKVVVPHGWASAPSSLPVQVAANTDSAPLSVSLTPPATMTTGNIPIMFTLCDQKGSVLDAYSMSITVAPPVEVTPQLPTAFDAAKQPLSVMVKNTTQGPLQGTVRLTLTPVQGGPSMTLPAQTFEQIAAGASATITFVAPDVPLIGHAWNADYTVDANNLQVSARQLLALHGWLVVGPFAQDFDKSFAPEQGVDTEKDYTTLDGKITRWKLATSDASGFVNLLSCFQPNEYVSAYAAVYVKSPTARKALLSAGSDDGIKAWVNGKLVVSDNASRGAAPGQDQVTVNLLQGWNLMLLRITQGNGGWGFYFDLQTAGGQPMPDLVYSTSAHGN